MILGRNLIVSIDGVPVAGSKSCQFQISQNFIQACAPTEGRTKRKIPTDYDWSISVDCLIQISTMSVSMVDKLIAGTRVLLTFTDGSGQNRAGFAYVKSCNIGGSVGNLATFSASFESDGALYKYTPYNNGSYPQEGEGFVLDIYRDDIYFDYDGQRQGGPYVVEVNPNKQGTIYIFTHDVWSILGGQTLEDVEYWLGHHDSQSLEINTTKFGDSNSSYEITSQDQYCTIVCNEKPIVLFLY